MRYHLFQKFFGKMVKIKETSFLFTVVDSLTHTTVCYSIVLSDKEKDHVNVASDLFSFS